MNNPPRPGPGEGPRPETPWYLRRPTSDDRTRSAIPRPAPPRPAYGPPPASQPPPPTSNIAWYLQHPNRPQSPASGVQYPRPTRALKDPGVADRKKIVSWLLVGGSALAVVIGTGALLSTVFKLGINGEKFLDVTKVQAGVLQTLADPASGYGANTVTDVSCNNGRNPSAAKGTTFTCDATVNGSQRHVTVLVSDDTGTYEIDGPR